MIVAFFVVFGYSYFAGFYRASAREMKRLGEEQLFNFILICLYKILLDSLLRSVLYSHFSESLTGLATIRSYGEVDRFLKDNQFYIDLEDRALFLTITNQRYLLLLFSKCIVNDLIWYIHRWMAICLDIMGGLVTFIVCILLY